MVNICLTFNFAGIECYLIFNLSISTRKQAHAHNLKFDRTKLREDRVEVKHSRRESTISRLKNGFLSRNVGQTIVQDGRSSDHGISGSSVSYFSIHKCFQARKWVTNQLLNSTTLKLPASRETSYTECM